MNSTSNTCSSMAPSSRSTRRRPAHGGTSKQGIGRSRGGLASKVVAVVDALGYLVRFVILPGQAHDLAGVPALLEDLGYGALIGDKAFDADWLIAYVPVNVPRPKKAPAWIPSD